LDEGRVSGKGMDELALSALADGIINADEHAVFARAKRLADEAIRVDHFAQDLGLAERLRAAQATNEREVA